MAKISVVISDELEKKLRVEAMQKFGMRKGYLSKALIEAIERWLKEA